MNIGESLEVKEPGSATNAAESKRAKYTEIQRVQKKCKEVGTVIKNDEDNVITSEADELKIWRK